MANLPETPQWEEGIYQIEVSDPVLGGPDGISNRQGKQLASRTLYLKQQVENGGTDLAKHIAAADPHTQYAPKASPTFTGTPTAPTPANSDNSKKLATTEFVAKALAALAGSAPETLDTLKELADALGNDPNFATTVLNKLAEKLAKDQNGADIPDPALFVKNLGLGDAAKMDAATLDITSNSLVAKIPVLFLGEQRALIIQASSLSSSSTSGTIIFPAAFPNACIIALTHDYSSAGTDLSNVKFNVPSQTSVNWYVQNMGTGSTSVPPSSWGWLAIGW
ncbi:gp53-like domain-containing protein [Citrobacter amalonaticus]|uniref:gp53-like domain-containing protein n=2 Tax=Citrobacter amalonaticus TaxID=35703 RepID=UPI001E34CBB3|nr:phage tail protein [Citrobacter amalonaticus]